MSGHFETAIQHVLQNEGGYFESASTGEISNFGISLAFLKRLKPYQLQVYQIDQSPDKNTIVGLDRETAIRIYRDHFWAPLSLDRVTDSRVATKIFDMAVNLGPGPAVRIAQTALREDLRTTCVVDGKMGPRTLFHLNNVVVEPLLNAVRARQAAHYLSLIEKNPKLAAFKAGWLKRAAQ